MFLDVNLVKRISEDSIARKDFTWGVFFQNAWGLGMFGSAFVSFIPYASQ